MNASATTTVTDTSETPPRSTRRRWSRGITLLVASAATAMATMVAAPVAEARAVSSSADIQSYAQCDATKKTMAIWGQIILNQNRFADGAHVVYRYWWKDTASTQWRNSTWGGPVFIDNPAYWTGQSGPYLSNETYIVEPVSTQAMYLSTSAGRSYVTAYEIGVWNGRYYEFTTDNDSRYTTKRDGYYGTRNTTTCDSW